jgi:DNA primase
MPSSSSSVEKIKEKLDIVDVVGSYLKLDKAGASYKGKCPFHNEKTPSFFVSPARGTYYCFGCGAKGDIFTFVEEFEGLDFVGALKLLATRAGVTLDDFPRTDNSRKEKMLAIMEEATKFFEAGLKTEIIVKKYLHGRGLTDETITSWRIGYVAKDWRLIYAYLKEKGISDSDMLSVGLIKKTDRTVESGAGYYDVFRGRIMFPIFDTSGRVIAFSGRIVDEEPNAPKYLNSPETSLFNKSETLYGLDRAKLAIRKKDYSILVEGQLDILMCHQAGFDNAVASSGTAITGDHLGKLKRLSNRIVLAFDSDKAGFTAANKSAVLALTLGMEVKIAEMPKGSDPAELILKDINTWKESLKGSKHLIDFYLDNLISTKTDKRALAKEIEKKVLPYIALLSSAIEQSHFVSQVSKKAGIREEAIWNDLRVLPKGLPDLSAVDSEKKIIVDTEIAVRKNYIERHIAGILYWQKDEKDKDRKKIINRIESELNRIKGKEYLKELLKKFLDKKEELIFEVESYYESNELLDKGLIELLENFEEDQLREEFVVAMGELDQAEKSHDSKRTNELLEKCQSISTKLAELAKARDKEA